MKCNIKSSAKVKISRIYRYVISVDYYCLRVSGMSGAYEWVYSAKILQAIN